MFFLFYTYKTFFARGVRRVGSWMRKTFSTMFAFKRFLSRVNSFVLLQMVLEFKGFSTFPALEFPQVWTVIMIGHVSLQLCQVGELFGADCTRLWTWKWLNINIFKYETSQIYLMNYKNMGFIFCHMGTFSWIRLFIVVGGNKSVKLFHYTIFVKH